MTIPASMDTPQVPVSVEDIVLLARQALQTEAQAISNFAMTLGDSFAQAVGLLCQPSGRIIVTGIGKSGHVARKIAATLSSIGRPALFVHPSEASHGDLGMIMAGDLLFALSNSGETPELLDILAYCADLGLPLIALVGPADSTLALRADVALAYGAVHEVCANGLAPTTSTTLAIAIGDALAVAAMHVIGTTPAHFHQRHPRGRLGVGLLRVSDLMHSGTQLPLVHAETRMEQVVEVASRAGFGVAIVVDGNNGVIGVITDGDLRRHAERLGGRSAMDLSTGGAISVQPGLLASDALDLMTRRAITSLVVLDGQERVVGLLHIHDCLRAGL